MKKKLVLLLAGVLVCSLAFFVFSVGLTPISAKASPSTVNVGTLFTEIDGVDSITVQTAVNPYYQTEKSNLSGVMIVSEVEATPSVVVNVDPSVKGSLGSFNVL